MNAFEKLMKMIEKERSRISKKEIVVYSESFAKSYNALLNELITFKETIKDYSDHAFFDMGDEVIGDNMYDTLQKLLTRSFDLRRRKSADSTYEQNHELSSAIFNLLEAYAEVDICIENSRENEEIEAEV